MLEAPLCSQAPSGFVPGDGLAAASRREIGQPVIERARPPSSGHPARLCQGGEPSPPCTPKWPFALEGGYPEAGGLGTPQAGRARLVVAGIPASWQECLQNRATRALAGKMPAAGAGEMPSSLSFIYMCVCTYISICIYTYTHAYAHAFPAKGATQNTASANTLK